MSKEPEHVEAVVDVLAKWGVRSHHGEWSDRETQLNATRDILRALDWDGREHALRFRVETACDGYAALMDSDVPPDITFHDDYLQGAHDAAEGIRSVL